MTERYHGEACGWDGETPVRAEDPLSEFIFTLRVCPDCGAEVYATLVPPPVPPAQN